MTKVNVAEAKARLSALIDAALAGEQVVIARRNVPMVRLTVVGEARARPQFGKLRGLVRLAEDFDALLDDFREHQSIASTCSAWPVCRSVTAIRSTGCSWRRLVAKT